MFIISKIKKLNFIFFAKSFFQKKDFFIENSINKSLKIEILFWLLKTNLTTFYTHLEKFQVFINNIWEKFSKKFLIFIKKVMD